MPIRSKTVRLSKAAREFNVGISTIVEYLASKGYEIESKPNTKIEADAYEVLVEEFQDSKQLKEKSKLAGVTPGKRETVSIKKEAVEPKKEEPKKEEPKEEKKKEDPTIKPSVEKKPGISVVGKIDLDKKKAEKEAPKEEKKEEPKKEEKPSEKKEEVKAKEEETPKAKDEPKKEEPKEAEDKKPKKDEVETIRTNVTKLGAPTVVGKIDLPKETPKKKKKKPVMSTDPETETQQ